MCKGCCFKTFQHSVEKTRQKGSKLEIAEENYPVSHSDWTLDTEFYTPALLRRKILAVVTHLNCF